MREIWSEYRNGFVTDIKEKLSLSKKTVDYTFIGNSDFFIKFSEKKPFDLQKGDSVSQQRKA